MPLHALLVLLRHNDRGFPRIKYLIKPLIANGRKAGREVEVVRGPDRRPPADLL